MALLFTMFVDERQRGTALGVLMGCFAVGAALGPVLGGVLLDSFWWGSVFLINVPVMLVVLVAGPRLLPEYRAPDAALPDFASVVLSLVAVLGVIYGIKRGAQDGIDLAVAGTFVAGVLAGLVFLRRQSRLRDPLVDLGLFRSPRFSAAMAIAVATAFVMYGAYLLSTGFMQLVEGLSALEAGLWLVPSAIAVGAGANLGPLFARRISPGLVVAGGLTVMVAGFVAMAQLDTDSPLAQLIVASVVIHLGIGPAMPLLTEMVVGAAPPERAGAASALNHTGNELGGALGLGLLGTLATAVYRDDTGSEGAAFGAPGRIVEDAFAHAFQVTALTSAALVAGAVALALVVLRAPSGEPAPSAA
jgi:MFS transporter, DHA2 family, multidrug resistance protein